MDSVRKMAGFTPTSTMTSVVVLGAQLVPDDIAAEGLLTPEDYQALALDHIERTSDAIFQFQIILRS